MNSLSLIPRMPDALQYPAGSERPRHYGRGPRFPQPLSRMSAPQRQRADLPSFEREVRLHVRMGRFYCNQACPEHNFTEPPLRLLKPYARHALRLGRVIA